MKIFSGRCSCALAQRIAERYGTAPGRVSVSQFSDGEIQPIFEEAICSDNIIIIQSTYPPAENFHELLMLIDAARNASARSIVAIIPYFGYSLWYNQVRPGVSRTPKLHARLLEAAGVNRIITLDFPANEVEGFFNIPVDNLHSTKLFSAFIKSMKLENVTFCATDANGTLLAEKYARLFGTNYAICNKSKPKHYTIDNKGIVGDVKGRNIILPDNIVNTAGSICCAAKIVMDNGALSVRAIVTHPLLSGDAYERIENSDLEELIVTDTIPLAKTCSKIKVISTADLFAEAIHFTLLYVTGSKISLPE